MNSVPSQWWQHLGGWMRLLCICTHGWDKARCSPPSQIPKTPYYHMCQPLQVWKCWASCTFSFGFALHSFSQFGWGFHLRSCSQGGITLLWGMVWVRWAVTDTHPSVNQAFFPLSFQGERRKFSKLENQVCVCWIFLNPLLRSILENLW